MIKDLSLPSLVGMGRLEVAVSYCQDFARRENMVGF